MFIVTLYSILIYHSLHETLFYTHLFLMFISFVISLVGAYLIEESTLEFYSKAQDFQEVSMVDELTELSSRSRFDFIIKTELERSRRYKYQFGLLILEIDDFRAICKKFGKQILTASKSFFNKS